MASVMANITTSLLIFISILQGTVCQTAFIEHITEVNAAVGQNISLPCNLSKKHSKIIQLQWHKKGKDGEQSLVVFNPLFSPIYHANVTLELVRDTSSTHLRGSILHLQEVTEKDSGEYVCDITSFPDGNIKNSTKVQVTVPKVSVNVTPANRIVIEGDTVSITCVCNPPPDKYMLSSSLIQSIIESEDGKFIIQNITRHMSDLICQPLWKTSNQFLQNLNAAVHLTIDFLDDIECKSESQIQVETGTNLTITCEAKSSKSLHFVWMKDNMTVSSNASINLWSVSSDQSGIYTLIVHTGNHRLQRRKDFTVTVMNRRHTEPLSSTTIMETTPQISSTTMTTPEVNVTTPTLQTQHNNSTTNTTSTEEVININTSAPSTGNVTGVHLNLTTPHTRVQSSDTTFTHTTAEGMTLHKICLTSSPGSTSREVKYLPSDVSTSKSHGMFIIPFLLMLVLIGFLYRQYHIQKRLDMPPPFKPPPPPIKYTSARNQDIIITEILE